MENLTSSSSASATKRIRVFYSDPDATDSSSDEENKKEFDSNQETTPKRKVHEFTINNINNQSKKNKSKKNTPFVGAHRRRMGKYSSEITDPFTKRRVWLGTFMNAQEASKAYCAKKREFQDKIRAKQGTPEEEEEKREEFGFFNGVQVVDNYGFLLGEFSVIDDLSI